MSVFVIIWITFQRKAKERNLKMNWHFFPSFSTSIALLRFHIFISSYGNFIPRRWHFSLREVHSSRRDRWFLHVRNERCRAHDMTKAISSARIHALIVLGEDHHSSTTKKNSVDEFSIPHIVIEHSYACNERLRGARV